MEKISKDDIQGLALEAILPYNRCTAAITVGGGKTRLGLMHMNKNYTDYCMFLVVAPKKAIMQSWLDEIDSCGYQYLIPHIKFTTYLSLDKQHTDFDVIYLDEVHSLLESHDEYLDSYDGKILGLTGTKPRFKHSEKGKMVEKYCPVAYEYTTDEAITDDILNDYEIIVHTLSLDINKNILVVKPDKQWYTSEQNIYNYWTQRIQDSSTPKSLQITRIQRMKAMMEFPSKEYLTKSIMNTISNKCLVFANTMVQADKLCSNSYHSDNENSKDNLQLFKEGEIMKLSCVLQLSEGINIPELKECIILHSYSNERKTMQRIGRALRLNPNDKAIIHILCYKNTIDTVWVNQALSQLDQTKIKYV